MESDPDARSGGIGQAPSTFGHKNANLSQNDIKEKILHQLSALGGCLTKIEKHESSIGKKTKDKSKVKSSRKSSIVENSTARRPTAYSDNGVVSPSCQTSIATSGAKFPPPNVLRQEQNIQEGVQLRFKELAENVKTGNNALKS